MYTELVCKKKQQILKVEHAPTPWKQTADSMKDY